MKRRALLLTVLPGVAQAAALLRDGQALRGRFVQQRHLQGFAHPLRSKGRFLLAPRRGLLWRVETPFAVTTAISPAGLVQDVGGNQTLRMPAARLPFLSRLYAMLSGALAGDWSGLEHDFLVRRSGTADAWQVVLAPRGGADAVAMPLSGIEAAGTMFVETVRMNRANGDWDELRFFDQVLSDDVLAPDEQAALAAIGT